MASTRGVEHLHACDVNMCVWCLHACMAFTYAYGIYMLLMGFTYLCAVYMCAWHLHVYKAFTCDAWRSHLMFSVYMCAWR